MGNLYYASYKYKHVLQFGTYSYLNLPHNHPNKTMIDIIGVITPAQNCAKAKNNAEILAT